MKNKNDDLQEYINLSQKNLACFTIPDIKGDTSNSPIIEHVFGDGLNDRSRYLIFEIVDRNLESSDLIVKFCISSDIANNITKKINERESNITDIIDSNYRSIYEDKNQIANDDYITQLARSGTSEDVGKIVNKLISQYTDKEVCTDVGTTALILEAWYHGKFRRSSFRDKYNTLIDGLFLAPCCLNTDPNKSKDPLDRMANFLELPHLDSGEILWHCGKQWKKELSDNDFKWIEYSLVNQLKNSEFENSLLIHYPLIIDDYFFLGLAYLATAELSEPSEMYEKNKYPKMLAQINIVANQIKDQRKRRIIQNIGKDNNTDRLRSEVWIDAVKKYFACFKVIDRTSDFSSSDKRYATISLDMLEPELKSEQVMRVPKWILKDDNTHNKLKEEIKNFYIDVCAIYPERSKKDDLTKDSSDSIKPYIYTLDELYTLKQVLSSKNDKDSCMNYMARLQEELSQAFILRSAAIEESIEKQSNNTEIDVINYKHNLVVGKIDFEGINKNRHQIAAFVIGLEWKNVNVTKKELEEVQLELDVLGYTFVRLLIQSYPEIPCFISTEQQSINAVQQSLANGAAWCFHRQTDSTAYIYNSGIKKLTTPNLNRHLADFATLAYGTYEDLPNPNQFDSRSNPREIKKLEERLGIKFDWAEHREFQELKKSWKDEPTNQKDKNRFKKLKALDPQNFKLLIARLFTTENISVTKVMNNGKSGAAATFFVSPSGKGTQLVEATRFVKVGYWLEIQKEYLAYQQVIKPKLNNHIARIIQPPAVVPSSGDTIDWNNASIVSSLAGFPEGYDNIRPLKEIFDKYIKEDTESILDRILNTIEYVLIHLQLPTRLETYHFAEEAPCLYTGEWILTTAGYEEKNPESEDGKLDFSQERESRENGNESPTCFRLKGWLLTKISDYRGEDDKVDPSKCNITLTHVTTRAKIKLRGQTEHVVANFSALWIRLGMPVTMCIALDSENEDIKFTKNKLQERWNKISPNDNHHSKDGVINDLLNLWGKDKFNSIIKDPVAFFERGDVVANLTLDGIHLGGIHGDLNLNNILFPKNNTVGFLIDFSESKLEGLSAFDLAWLEAQIWNHYLFPNIVELAELLLSKYRRSSEDKNTKICELLNLALIAINTTANPDELFAAKTGIELPPSTTRTCIKNALIVTYRIRKLITDKLELGFQGIDVNYALTVCFYRQAKFEIDFTNKAQESDWINLLSYLCSTYYFNKLTEQVSNFPDDNAA